MGCYASLGLLGIHQSVCGLDYNINHIRNAATYSFIFSFSYCKLTEFKILSLYNLDSTIISNLSLLVRHSPTKIIFSMNFIHLIYTTKSMPKFQISISVPPINPPSSGVLFL